MANRKEPKWTLYSDGISVKSNVNSDPNAPTTSPCPSSSLIHNRTDGRKEGEDEAVNYDYVPSLFECGHSFEKAMAHCERRMEPVEKKHSKMDYIMQMIDSFENIDIQVKCHGFSFHLHSIVLNCYSPFFRNLKNALVVELPVAIRPEIFAKIYDWMLADSYDLEMDDLVELYKVAGILGIECLSKQCFMCIDNREIFREDTAFEIYRQAREHNVANLVELMLSRICKYFLSLVATRVYLNLRLDELLPLLRSNQIGVNTEIEVFFAAIRWLSYDFEDRKQHVAAVMACVRFALIPPWYLIALNREPMCENVQRITEQQEVRREISLGISFITTQLYCKGNPQGFLSFLAQNKMAIPRERYWIFDGSCRYHLRSNTNPAEYISYEHFLSHLLAIRSVGKNHWQTIEAIQGDHLGYLFSLRRDGKQLIQPVGP